MRKLGLFILSLILLVSCNDIENLDNYCGLQVIKKDIARFSRTREVTLRVTTNSVITVKVYDYDYYRYTLGDTICKDGTNTYSLKIY